MPKVDTDDWLSLTLCLYAACSGTKSSRVAYAHIYLIFRCSSQNDFFTEVNTNDDPENSAGYKRKCTKRAKVQKFYPACLDYRKPL